MPIADLILTRIVDAGFEVEVGKPEAGDPDFYFISARDKGTGRTWACSGTTMTDAATGLAERLGLSVTEEELRGLGKEGAVEIGAMLWSAPAGVSGALIAAVLTVMGVIFLLDLATPGLNIGVLYVVPLCLANWGGVKKTGLLSLTGAMMGMVLVDAVVGQFSLMGNLGHEPQATLNRCFGMVAIGGSAAVMMLVQSLGEAGRQRAAAGRGWASLEGIGVEWVMGAVAVGLIGLTFGLDIVTPAAADLPILYLVPLGIVAYVWRRGMKWSVAGVVLGLVVVGYMFSPKGGLGREEARLVLENRWITAAGLVVMVGVMEVLGWWKRREVG
jgi:hypothetical protein